MTNPAHLSQLLTDRIPTTEPVFETVLEERIQRARRLGVEPHPAHIEAAVSLLAEGDFRRADAVLACAPPGWFGFACRLRLDCPSCTLRAQQTTARAIVETARAYASPVALLATLPSRSLEDLGPTLDALVSNFATVRRQTWFKANCIAGVGALEVPRVRGNHRWNVHAHAIADLRLEPDAVAEWQARADHAWADLARVGGARLTVEPLRSVNALALYAVKLSAPPPSWSLSSLPPSLHNELRAALHRRRLLVRWGRPDTTKGTA